MKINLIFLVFISLSLGCMRLPTKGQTIASTKNIKDSLLITSEMVRNKGVLFFDYAIKNFKNEKIFLDTGDVYQEFYTRKDSQGINFKHCTFSMEESPFDAAIQLCPVKPNEIFSKVIQVMDSSVSKYDFELMYFSESSLKKGFDVLFMEGGCIKIHREIYGVEAQRIRIN